MSDSWRPSGEIGFRDVAAALYQATLEHNALDLARCRFELAVSTGKASGSKTMSVLFEGVSIFKWHRRPDPGAVEVAPGKSVLSVVGLERLAADEPWRLYVLPRTGGELEITCARISCDELEVTGIGRAYKS